MTQSQEKTSKDRAMDRTAVSSGGPIALIMTASWIGLLTGYLEVLHWAIRSSMIDPFTYLSRDLVWMAPLANLAAFFMVGGFFALLMCLRNDHRWFHWTIFSCSFFAFLSLLFLFDGLHPFASALFAMGLAYQISLILRPRLERILLLVHHSFTFMGLLLLGLIGGAQGWNYLVGLNTAARPTSVSTDSPNILLIVMDTVRAKSLSLYGHYRHTSPNLEELAKSGIVFEEAISTSPWTLPAHASLFTGQYPHQLSTSWHSALDESSPTLAEVLRRFGYRTSGFVANTTYCSYESGLDRGFDHFEDYSVSMAETFRSSSLIRRPAIQFFALRRLIGNYDLLARKSAEAINADFLTWLDQGVDQPFFSFLNYFDAHDPYLPSGKFEDWGPQKVEDYSLTCHWWALDKQALSSNDVSKVLKAYEGSIGYIDSQIGQLLTSLENRGYLRNTIIVVTSDHGEAFGEHGLFGHGNCLYRPVLQVPLVLSFPSALPAGLRLGQPVSIRDIPATLMDLIGADKEHRFPGSTLARYWKRNAELDLANEFLLSEIKAPSRIPPDHGRSPISNGPMQAIIFNGTQYIKNLGNGSEELYDFIGDPEETHDLSKLLEYREDLRHSRDLLNRLSTGNKR